VIRAVDLRGIFHILGEIREMGYDPVLWRRHLLNRFLNMVGGVVGMLVEYPSSINPHRPGRLRINDSGIWSPSERQVFQDSLARFQEQGDYLSNPYADIHDSSEKMTVFSGMDLLGKRKYYNNPFVNELMMPVNLGDGLKCSAAHAQDVLELHVYRANDDRPFENRENEMAMVLLAEVSLMRQDMAGFEKVSAFDLSPRLQAVFRLILMGRSEREIARELGISAHTVHDHTKILFRKFRVRSRMELMAVYFNTKNHLDRLF